jgi:hypothetical protein
MSSVAFSLDRPTTATVRLLQIDGVLCAAMGAAMAIAAGPVSGLLGTDATGVVRAVGIALVVYAVVLAASARSHWSSRMLRAAGIGNIGWEVGSLAVAVLADLSATGRVLVAAQGLAVGLLAVVQLRAGRH